MPADKIKREYREELTFDSGIKYEGEWDENNNTSGKGKQVWPNGTIYEGYWKDNETHFYGRVIHHYGDVYCGQWKNGKANGYGTYYCYESGSKYTGYFYED